MAYLASSYPGPPFYLFHYHLETIYPSRSRRVEGVRYDRERLELPDGDFLDMDWVRNGNNRVAFISHGLEGSSDRPYVLGLVKLLQQNGWDTMAWNCRSCSGELNRLPRMYHQGVTDDMGAVMDRILDQDQYEEVAMIAFSLGGGMTLKYLGEKGRRVDQRIKRAIVFSVPVDLPASVKIMRLRKNWFYRWYFLQKLEKKVRLKAEQFPEHFSLEGFDSIKYLEQFDERYTAPMFGFRDAWDYYTQVNPRQFLPDIQIPTLIVNAQNDPILAPVCTQEELVRGMPNISLEAPRRGGHVGFCLAGKEFTWSEMRALSWISRTE